MSMALATSVTAACGDDRSSESQLHPGIIEPSAGQAGETGSSSGGTSSPPGGMGGEGGAAGGEADTGWIETAASALGSACKQPSDCPRGLTCLSDTSEALDQGSPPGGVCTFDCNRDELSCSDLGGRCLDIGKSPYCMQSCAFGPHAKCHGRHDFACEPTYRKVDVRCDVDSDCASSAVCRNGSCYLVYPLCLPRCNADSDCPRASFCDPVSGECVATEPTGKSLGAACSLAATPDECRGICLPTGSATEGRCQEFCTLGAEPACGDDASCLLGLDSQAEASDGDQGLCVAAGAGGAP